MQRLWWSKFAVVLALTFTAAALPADGGGADRSWIERAVSRVERTGQTTVIHRRFCRHIDIRCPPLGVDTKFRAMKDEAGEHDFGVVLKRPRIILFFFMDKSSNVIFAMRADGSVYRVIHIDLVTQEHVVLPATADQDLFARERAFWQRQLPADR